MENNATNGLRTLQTWYCGRTNSGRERLFERTLRRFGIETYIPVTPKRIPYEHHDDNGKLLRHGTINRECPLFPGYVFAALDDYGWARTRSVEVARKPRWLDFGSGPVQIPVELIEDLREREQNGFIATIEEAEVYHQGDELEVTDGVYRGWRGILSSDPERRVLTLHMITESYALEPTRIIRPVKIEREYTRRVSY